MDLTNLKKEIQNQSVSITIFGLGRIGLPTALMYTKGGYKVHGIDINSNLIEDLKNRKTFVDEPGVPELLDNAIDKNLIDFSSDYKTAIEKSKIIVICVPTPVNANKIPNYNAIIDVAHKVGKCLSHGQIVINESSVSPTTIDSLIIPILEEESKLKVNVDFGVCSCPERADPGTIILKFDKVARVVGGSSTEIGEIIVEFYKNITKAQIIQVSTPGTANAVKLTENIFRDVNIALMNELAILYERLGIDVKEVIKGASTKYNFQPHFPGPGVGGPCLPANPYYIIQDAEKVNYIPFLIRVSREVNDRMPQYVLELTSKALNYVGKSIKGTPIAVLGISYKANVRDIQISPAMKVIENFQEYNADLRIWDPYFIGETIAGCEIKPTIEETLEGCECIVCLTDHTEIKDFQFHPVINKSKQKIVLVDSRNIYDIKSLPKEIIYCGVGRKIQEL